MPLMPHLLLSSLMVVGTFFSKKGKLKKSNFFLNCRPFNPDQVLMARQIKKTFLRLP